ncbi:MAG: hypothetical protein PWP01_283 [Methanosarcinales archaeon]|nr:hypothetical protein [Methanosarcinales archaeon]
MEMGKQMNPDLRVKDIMTREVVVADVGTRLPEVGRLLIEHDIGSVVVVEDDKPVGIVTDRDLARKVVANNKKPDELTLREVMTAPLITIHPDATVLEAIDNMLKEKVRKLPVVEDGRLVGIITERDVLSVSAEINEIMRLLVEGRGCPEPERSDEGFVQGICEACGQFSENLQLVNGRLLCESCRE